MTLAFNKRKWVAVTATLLATLGGAVFGYVAGCAGTLRAADKRLTEAAKLSGGPFVSLLDESSALLAQVNASKFPRCSDAEMGYLQRLLLQSEYLRDAGRMRGGRIECSTLFDRKDLPTDSFQPIATDRDGLRIYRDVPPYLSPKWPVFLLQKGDSFVVEDLSTKNRWQPPAFDYESTLLDVESGQRVRPGGKPILNPGAILDRNAEARFGNLQYVTVCWPHSTFCTSVFEPYSAMLWADRGPLALKTALGAVSGLSLALIFLFLYQNDREMGRQLRRAIRRGELELVYQPIVELASGRIVGAEALSRWTDEDGYAVDPEIFVRLAEERGFVGELTAWVIRRSLSDFGQYLQRHPEFRINVNVTASDLANERFLPMRDRCLKEAFVAAHSLAIEVTEGSPARSEVAIEAIRKLRQSGHSVQIDDFGTGYSSLAYLKDLAVDVIKIDKSFAQAIGTDAVTVVILPQILAIAEALNLQVIVEGIETVEQAAYFAGKDMPLLGQGWLFGRPASAAELLRSLEEQRENVEAASSVMG
jgi:sensor c-di-GMP phosphodiesterase-like protein